MFRNMRLFTKIFLCGTLVFGLAFSISGYFLLYYSMESSMAREADFALKQFQYDKFTVQSALLTYKDAQMSMIIVMEDNDVTEREKAFMIWQAFPEAEMTFGKENGVDGQGKPEALEQHPQLPEPTGALFDFLAGEISLPVAFFAEDKTLLYSEIEGLDSFFTDSLSEDAHVFRFWNDSQGSSVLVGGMVECSGLDMPEGDSGEEAGETDSLRRIFFVTQWDISKTVGQQETLQQYFVRCYMIAMAIGMVLLGGFSVLLTGPLKRMSKAADRMAKGDYEERLAIAGRDEIGELAVSFNQMAEAVEEKVEALSDAAREKEDFVANFAHELKTPLTSIIGYADMIYQKDLSREAVKDASWYIWNEGMRLEALSLKLMDLAVLGRQDFPLQEMAADELLQDVAEGLRPVFQERGIEFSLEAERTYVKVDYDLLKTLLINLMDNSMKAGCSRITVLGKLEERGYQVSVEDDGCGMEEEELSRITEAFYMVDKARSRKQHGAGLGLALAERIARVHGCELTFRSRKGEGTRVSFCLDCEKGGVEDEEEED